MKAVKGKLMKKLKSIKPVGYLKPDRVLHAFAADGFIDSRPKTQIEPQENPQLTCKEPEQQQIEESVVMVQEPDVIDVAELMRDLEEEEEEEEEEMDFDEEINDKENVRPVAILKENMNFQVKSESANSGKTPLSEIDISSFRKPDLNSGTLFDPNLLAAFQQAVKEHIRMSEAGRKARIEEEEEKFVKINREETENIARTEQENPEELEPPHKTRRIEDFGSEFNTESDPLLQFEEKCPPGGDGAMILYTTTLSGIRKTFEDCNSVRFLLQSSRVLFFERDVSMHMEYREELWGILGFKAVPPRLFIQGRYIGGAEEVLTLNEQGKLKLLFEGIPRNRPNGDCEVCLGIRFVLCFKCNGSHKIVADEGGSSEKCCHCNENGLTICPFCC